MAERRLKTTYPKDMALLPSRVQKFWVLVLMALLAIFPLIARSLPSSSFWLSISILVLIASIGSLGLNLLSGMAGQISLGHAFFLGVGAFAGAVISSESTTTLSGIEFWGLGLPWWVGVIGAGLVAAVIGVIIGPTAVRLRGLYLSLVTLALVFLGEFLFLSPALEPVTGAVRGRTVDPITVLPWIEDPDEQLYYACAVVAVISYIVGRNLVRGRVGRAFQATRDRDIAAEVMGVNVTWAKLTAFGVSSFYAGAAGMLLGVFLGNPLGANFGGSAGLLVSVEYVAMIVIGGIGTVSGSALGAVFVVALPELVAYVSNQGWLPFVAEPGTGSFDASAFSVILFGLFIIGFLVFEPRGLFGIWLRVKNYWRGWPFSY